MRITIVKEKPISLEKRNLVRKEIAHCGFLYSQDYIFNKCTECGKNGNYVAFTFIENK